jgi:hypothetical protein
VSVLYRTKGRYKEGFIAITFVLLFVWYFSQFYTEFYDMNGYVFDMIRNDTIYETKRIVVRTCDQLILEHIFAGMAPGDINKIQYQKNIYGTNVYCSVQLIHFEWTDKIQSEVLITLQVSNGVPVGREEASWQEYVEYFSDIITEKASGVQSVVLRVQK